MKRKLTRLLMMGSLLAVGSITAIAQEKKLEAAESKAPADGVFKVLAPQFAFGKVVKGAPYSATASTETTQTLADGNQIIRKNESKLYRDSEGRVRTEQTLGTIGKWTADGLPNQLIFINDPVAGVSFSLDPHERTAQKSFSAPQKPLTVEWNENMKVNGQPVTKAEFEELMEKKRKAREEPLTAQIKGASDDAGLKKKLAALQSKKPDGGQRTTELLGRQVIEGIEVEGKRVTTTIPAGEIGNTRPIEIVDEAWYAPALQIAVMTKHSDPRSGETTYRLTNLSRNEPPHSLFEIPPDYSVKDGPAFPKMKQAKEDQ
jgi:hypothetical protein